MENLKEFISDHIYKELKQTVYDVVELKTAIRGHPKSNFKIFDIYLVDEKLQAYKVKIAVHMILLSEADVALKSIICEQIKQQHSKFTSENQNKQEAG